ncbi:MAG TPA: hypothetical protein VGM29_14065, partial [Polyangiaceae bacterium]
GDLPSERELAALSLRLGATFGAGAGLATGGTAARTGGTFAKLAAATVVTVGALGLWLAHDRPAGVSATNVAAAHASVQEPSAASKELAEPLATSLPSAVDPVAPSAAASAQPAVSTSKPATAKSALAVDEASLLERARRELNANPAAALALTNEHSTRFPNGVLAQEREVIAIAALRKLGRGAEADRRAASFALKYPGSAHARAVSTATQ